MDFRQNGALVRNVVEGVVDDDAVARRVIQGQGAAIVRDEAGIERPVPRRLLPARIRNRPAGHRQSRYSVRLHRSLRTVGSRP